MAWPTDKLVRDTMYLDRFHHGKEGIAADTGEIITSKENGVRMGSVRMWWWTDNEQYDTPILYVADREFKKWWPFKNVVWWRRIQMHDRLAELESFVNEITTAEFIDTTTLKSKAVDISKKGFLNKLKGIRK